MKKLFTLLSLFLCFASGAWAIETDGAMNGVFSVSSTKKVVFSQGNLQWSGTNGWRFASNQWDIIGSKANNTSPTSSNDNYMDLFCWGATGLNGVAPNTADSYLSGSSVLSGNNDWGTNMGASWRTLTSDEWAYLFNTRASGSTVNGTSNARYAFATIRTDVNSGINGIILFPDGVNFAASEFTTLGTVNGVSSYATKCTSDQWTALEGKGCVFLPAAGLRSGSTVSYAGVHGCYWSSSPYASYEADKAYDVYFGNVLSLPRETRRFSGSSVRLVKDYQLQQDGEGYYLLGTAQDWKDFAGIVNNTNPAANAKMTADIDLGDDQTRIGDNNNLSYAYCGVFDGQGHKLNVNYSSSSSSVEEGYAIAPFRNINGATIKNLTVTGNITCYMHCAGVVGYAVSPSTNLIKNVTVSANITILNTHGGGFIGHNESATTTIQDCLFNGTINGKSGGSTVGVFFGWSGSSATMSLVNCLENGSYTNCSTFTPTSCPGYAVPTVTNCYYAVSGSYPGTHATSAQLADGTIAYKLQNNRGDLVWGQRIGTDAEPVLTNDENYRVYRGKNDYTNSPEEAYEGIQQDGEGNYLLGCLSDWQDFAEIVNSGTNAAANAKMTADIDLGDDQTHIGYLTEGAEPFYAGVFDGQGHTLTVNYVGGSNQIVAPFTLISSATIKNLHVAGSIQSSYAYIGVVGMAGSGSVISNVWMSATMSTSQSGWVQSAAIAGYCDGDIQDCLFTGTYTSNGGGYMGGFYGYTNASPQITNCLSTGTFNQGNWQGNGVHTNCYLKQYPTSLTTGCSWATDEALADGTIAKALQNGRAEEIWVQDPVTNQPMLEIFANKISYKVPSSGIGTFSTSVPVVLPEGLEAYVCKTYDSGKSTISTQKVVGTIPANTGVLMKGIGGETYTLTASSETPEAIEGNALIAVVEATHVDQTVGEYTNFMMSGGKFVKIAASSNPNDKIPANRAYLPILTSALPAGSGQSITLNWDEETGVKAVRDAQFMINSYYTLDGRKLNGAPSKGGIYINNGKKVIK